MPKGIYTRNIEHGKHVWESRRKNGTDHWEVKDTTNIKNQKNRYKFPRGNVPWNANLTKDDERIAKSIEKGRKTLVDKYASRELKVWNDGLTKETNESVASMGKKNSELYKDKTFEERFGEEKARKTKEKLSEICFFKILNKENTGKTYEQLYGEKKGKELKQNKREQRIKQIEKEGGVLQKGRREKQILDEIERKENIIIDRQFRTIGYAPDGYCHETNTIYEVNESHHKNQIKEDLQRQKEIEDYLRCKFVIIEDNKE